MTAEPTQAVLEAARLLYGREPTEFIATRKELATSTKAAGDPDAAAEISRLRKPDVPAWAVNLTVRERPGAVADLVGLGARMRSAQAALDVAALQGMRVERDRAIEAFVAAAVEVVGGTGGRLSSPAQDAVRGTAIAVLADAGASDAVASGLLTKPLSYSGFGEVDVADAVAVTGSGVVLTAITGGGMSATGHTDDEGEAGNEEAGEEQGAEESGDERREDEGQSDEGLGEHSAGRRQQRSQQSEAKQAQKRRLQDRRLEHLRLQARQALESAREEEQAARVEAEQAAEQMAAAEAELDEARRRYDETLRAADAARTAASRARETLAAASRARSEAETQAARARRASSSGREVT